jgi:hypothetical protein
LEAALVAYRRFEPGGRRGRTNHNNGKALTPRQALAAMEIADAAGQVPAECDAEVYDDEFWSRIDVWAAELGLSGRDAVARVSEAPAG